MERSLRSWNRHRGGNISRRRLLRSTLLAGGLWLANRAGTRGRPARAAQPSPTGSWRRLMPAGAAPPARRDHSLVADARGRRVFLYGGQADVPLGDLWIYDTDLGEWVGITPVGATPPARFGHSSVYDAARERVLVFGGQARPGFFNDVWAYSVADNAWSLLAGDRAAPRARYGAGSALDPATQTFYVSHGFTDQGRFDDTWAFIAADEEWREVPTAGNRPLERCLLRAEADPERGRLLLFGGQSDTALFLGDLWALDLAGDGAWRQLDAPGPAPRNFYSLVRRDDAPHLLLFGGNTQTGNDGGLWMLDLATDSWSPVAPGGDAPSARNGHDAVWLPGRGSMLLFGGQGTRLLDDLWELSPA